MLGGFDRTGVKLIQPTQVLDTEVRQVSAAAPEGSEDDSFEVVAPVVAANRILDVHRPSRIPSALCTCEHCAPVSGLLLVGPDVQENPARCGGAVLRPNPEAVTRMHSRGDNSRGDTGSPGPTRSAPADPIGGISRHGNM